MLESMLQKINDEVFYATDSIIRFDKSAIELIKESALSSPRGRARICTHKSSEDSLHEMLIAMRSDSYIRPHRHYNKIESFHWIEGRADIVIFNESGQIQDIIALGPDKNFYYRLSDPFYHTVIIHSPIFVIHEITNGPFVAQDSDFASFAPEDGEHAREYISNLKNQVYNLI